MVSIGRTRSAMSGARMLVGLWYPVFRRLRRKTNKIMRSASMTTPPTTAPTITPKLVDFRGEPLAEVGPGLVAPELLLDFPGRPLDEIGTEFVGLELLDAVGVGGATDVAVTVVAPSRGFGFTTRNSRVRGVLVLAPWNVTCIL